MPNQLYNFHPGSHVKQGVDQGIEYIVEALNEVMFEGMHTTVLLETMAGKGTEVGRTFEEIARIIDGVKLKDYIGVCMDTCHIHEGDYDISATWMVLWNLLTNRRSRPFTCHSFE